MGMQLPEMRQFANLPPEQRLQQGLAGAHLPARGFYRVKTISRDQLQDATAARNMTRFQTPRMFVELFKGMSPQEVSSSDKIDKPELQNQPVLSSSKPAGLHGASDEPAQEVQITIRDV